VRSPEVAGRHDRRYNETPRQIEAAKELRRNFADFAVFPDGHRQAWRRSSIRFFRVTRQWAWDTTRAHFGISFSKIGLNTWRYFSIGKVSPLVRLKVRFGTMPP